MLFKGLSTLILAAGSVLILIPFLYMISTSLKDPAQIRSDSTSLFPRKPKMVEVNGTLEPLYEVDLDGQVHEYALIKNIPNGMGQFVDPGRPDVIHELKIN
jgi:ABC-type glycerol-3-phosphate transport system permease component